MYLRKMEITTNRKSLLQASSLSNFICIIVSLIGFQINVLVLFRVIIKTFGHIDVTMRSYSSYTISRRYLLGSVICFLNVLVCYELLKLFRCNVSFISDILVLRALSILRCDHNCLSQVYLLVLNQRSIILYSSWFDLGYPT